MRHVVQTGSLMKNRLSAGAAGAVGSKEASKMPEDQRDPKQDTLQTRPPSHVAPRDHLFHPGVSTCPRQNMDVGVYESVVTVIAQ